VFKGGIRVYVYLLKSRVDSKQRYIELTGDLRKRLEDHHAGKSRHTKGHAPWQLVVAVFFADSQRAHDFERYLKQGFSHAFASRTSGDPASML